MSSEAGPRPGDGYPAVAGADPPEAAVRLEPHLLVAGNGHILPVCHHRLEFAQLVVEAIRRLEPDAIAVEIPAALETAFVAAVDRLPMLSVVEYAPTARERTAERGYLLVEPADPLVEAVRRGRELGVPVSCVDANLFENAGPGDGLPDSYAVFRVGHRACFEAAQVHRFDLEDAGPDDREREAVVAHRLGELGAAHGRVLYVGGMAHAARVAARLTAGRTAFGERSGAAVIHRGRTKLHDLHPDSSREVLPEAPFLSAAYERARGVEIGVETGAEAAPVVELPAPRVISMASRRLVQSEAAADASPIQPSGFPLDRQRVLLDLLRAAARRYTEDTGDEVRPGDLRTMMKFLRNYALVTGRLQPDLYQVVVAARGSVDDNYAYEVWELATHYPWQDGRGALPVLRLTIDDLYDGKRTVRFHRREKTRRRRPVPVPTRVRHRVSEPGEWARVPNFGICSHEPESIVIENFANHLRRRAVTRFSEESARVEPFTTSILDGIDVRETIRHWHEGTIWVRSMLRERGKATSVVIVFDEDRDDERYRWKMDWQGEHDGEYDIGFYATELDATIVGPGIRRCEYGGLLMVHPPGQINGIWKDRAYAGARTKPEVLLMAAVDHTDERLVTYVAAKPPRSAMKAYAARFGKKIVYLPIGQFSPVTLKRIRVLHILSNLRARSWAGRYVW